MNIINVFSDLVSFHFKISVLPFLFYNEKSNPMFYVIVFLR